MNHGFVRVAAASPRMRVADCIYNAERILELMARAETEGVAVLVFPELSLTGYTCADLFHHLPLQRGATARSQTVRLGGEEIPFGTDLLFDAVDVEGLLIGVEICEDLWVPIPPS